jgi:hypothetical protein
MYLDLSPTPERQPRDWMHLTLDGTHRQRPAVVVKRDEAGIETVRPIDDIGNQIIGASICTGFDLSGAPSHATRVLLDHLAVLRCLNAPDHGLSVACEVTQDVAACPSRQQGRVSCLGITQPSDRCRETDVDIRAPVDVPLWPLHRSRA